jgi:hypothetical protein
MQPYLISNEILKHGSQAQECCQFFKENDKYVMNSTYIYLRAEDNRNPSEENVMENTCEVQ